MSRSFNGGNSLDIQAFLHVSPNHAAYHAVHVADGGSQNIDARLLDELFCLFRARQPFGQVRARFVDLRPMLLIMPCMLPTAGAKISTRVSSTNCFACSGLVSPLDRSGIDSWISEPVPISPISPSIRIEGLIAFSATTASRVWRTFSSQGNAERSKTIASNPALAASSA